MPKVRVRDAVTGEFVSKGEARRRPASTVSETVKRKGKGKGKKKGKKRR